MVIFSVTRTYRRALPICIFLLVCLTASAAGQPNRPENVPEDFVVTPNGYFHPSCVQQIEQDEFLDKDTGKIVTPSGMEREVQQCRFPHFDSSGRELVAAVKSKTRVTPSALCPGPHPTCNDGGGSTSASWIIYDSLYIPTPIVGLTQTMIVPNAPAVVAGQTVFLFPGLQSSEHGDTILQPVLGWNANHDNQWTISSWDCCVASTTVHGPYVAVSPGHKITGSMSGNSCNASTGVCATWLISTYDTNTRLSSTVASASSNGEAFRELFGAVLEAYAIGSCNEFPTSSALFGYPPASPRGGAAPFEYMTLGMGIPYIQPPAPWVVTKNPSSIAPACGYQSIPYDSSGSGAVYLTY